MPKDKLLKDYTMIQNTIIRTEKLDVYQKSCINNILSNEEDFKMSLNALAKRIPSSKNKCIQVINTLKELNIISVSKIKTPNGDWDSNVYKVNSEELFKYLEVVIDKDNVVINRDYLVIDKDNGSISQRPEVVHDMDTKNTNKNINIENIYSDLDNEDYVNKINKELEEDLFNRIKSNYDPGAIKKELDTLKDKGLSKLDLLKALENNLKIKSIKTKKEKSNDVENIFNYWNSKEIINHKKLTPVIEKAIDKALKIYSTEEIRQAIEIYSEILNSKFYFSYKWHISDFLSRKNGISTFMEDGSNRVNYEKWKKELDKNENTTRTAIRDRGVFNESAKDIKIELPKREHRSYTDEELAELGII